MNINNIIADLKSKINPKELVEKLGYQPKKAGRQYKICCPFHQEKTPSFSINISKGYYHCFGCEWHGDIISFLKEKEGIKTIEAVKSLSDMFNIPIDLKQVSKEKTKAVKVKKIDSKKQIFPYIDKGFAKFSKEEKSELASTPAHMYEKQKKGVQKMFFKYLYPSKNGLTSYKKKEVHKKFNKQLHQWENIYKKFHGWFYYDKEEKKEKLGKLGETLPYGYWHLSENDKDKLILVVEGEKDCESIWKKGYKAIHCNSYLEKELLVKFNCQGFIYIGDNDKAGKDKAISFKELCINNSIPVMAFTIDEFWKDAPEKADITDYLEADKKLNDIFYELLSIATINRVTNDSKEDKSINEKIETKTKAKGISFGKTLNELLYNNKTVTRRLWKDATANTFINYFEESKEIPALNKSLRNGGQEIGLLKLTEKPFKQNLKKLTTEDLVKEGFPKLSIKEFIDKFFDGNQNQDVWVINFKFFPHENNEKVEKLETEENNEDSQTYYTEKAYKELYENKEYISINGELYKYKKTYYVPVTRHLEEKRITNWLLKESLISGRQILQKSYVSNVYDWAIARNAIDAEKVNPKGLNLLNGVLEIDWVNNIGKPVFKPHSKDKIFTYCSDIAYNPDADNKYALKLLQCLDEPFRTIFLKTIACAFDMSYLRGKLGRNIRAMLLEGKGNNGKDALGAVIETIFGESMTNASFRDFKQYDTGRKFPLSKIEGCSISWSSENAGIGSLKDLQSLKAAITGDNIDSEGKWEKEYKFKPKCIFVFNCNEPPMIKSGLEAIKSRWAILRFTKKYVSSPRKDLGELKADPRFKDDPQFIKEKVAPAFLNILLSQLSDLAIKGINYEPIKESFEDLQRESCHLFQFCDDVGIYEDLKGKVYINELWDLLRQWYQDNGTLEIEYGSRGGEKFIWHDQPNGNDKNVKASNQIYKRFSELFPNIKKTRETTDLERKGQFYLAGITLRASTDNEPRNSIEDCHNQDIEVDTSATPKDVSLLTLKQKLDLFLELSAFFEVEKTVININFFINKTTEILNQLGLTQDEAQQQLYQRYKKKSRQLLTEEQWIDYLYFLSNLLEVK